MTLYFPCLSDLTFPTTKLACLPDLRAWIFSLLRKCMRFPGIFDGIGMMAQLTPPPTSPPTSLNHTFPAHLAGHVLIFTSYSSDEAEKERERERERDREKIE